MQNGTEEQPSNGSTNKPARHDIVIISLMWIIVVPTWFLFEFVSDLTLNKYVILTAPNVPYLFMLFLFIKNKKKYTAKLWHAILPGVIGFLPGLGLLFLFFCWSFNGFAP